MRSPSAATSRKRTNAYRTDPDFAALSSKERDGTNGPVESKRRCVMIEADGVVVEEDVFQEVPVRCLLERIDSLR